MWCFSTRLNYNHLPYQVARQIFHRMKLTSSTVSLFVCHREIYLSVLVHCQTNLCNCIFFHQTISIIVLNEDHSCGAYCIHSSFRRLGYNSHCIRQCAIFGTASNGNCLRYGPFLRSWVYVWLVVCTICCSCIVDLTPSYVATWILRGTMFSEMVVLSRTLADTGDFVS